MEPFKEVKEGKAPRCQAVLKDGRQCGNRADEDTGYCGIAHPDKPTDGILPVKLWPREWRCRHPSSKPRGVVPRRDSRDSITEAKPTSSQATVTAILKGMLMDDADSGVTEVTLTSRGDVTIRKQTKRLDETELRDAFAAFDKNGDGVISAKELKDVMAKLGMKMSDAEAREVVKEVDCNGDGQINFKEFVRMMMSCA